jgi:hypothetical protein
MDTIQHNPTGLHKRDETGITIVQHKHTKILGLKGRRQISSLQSTERGSVVTVVSCMSPTGHFIPPLLVFPRKNMEQELMDGTPPGSIHACHSLGLDTQREFLVVSSFHQTYKPDKRRPCYLGTGRAHTRNLEFITLARENHVNITCLPPHSSHKMQPLDNAFMGPWEHSTTKKFKNGSVHTQGESLPSTKLANYSEMHTSEQQQAR